MAQLPYKVPLQLVQERHHHDSASGLLHIERVQQLDDHLRAAHTLRTDLPKGKNQHLIGTVPLVFAEKWSRECGAAIGTKEWAKYAVRKLRSGEFEAFRVHKG